MNSRFTIFFILTRTLLMLVPLGLLPLPFFIFFNNDYKYEDEPHLAPAIIAALIIFPFVFLMVKNYKIIRIKLDDTTIDIINVVRLQRMRYNYSDVKKIDLHKHKIEGYQQYESSKTEDINYVTFTTICFKDGFELEMASDVYTNYREMIAYIESHKPVIQTM